MADDLEQTIRDAAETPAQAIIDGQSATARPLKDLIEADQYLAGKTAATSPSRGLRFSKFVPPGTA